MAWLRRMIPTLAAFAVALLTLALGFWQLDRARQRDALDARLAQLRGAAPVQLAAAPVAPANLEFHPVSARGQWRPEYTVLLDNQSHHGRPGYHVLTPLRLGESDMHVLVDRGWVAMSGDRRQPPRPPVPDGAQQVEGFARSRLPQFMALAGPRREGVIWSEVSVEGFAAWSGLRLQPLVLYQTSASADGLLRDWPAPGGGAERNRGYAIQWFGLSAMSVLFWAFTRRRSRA